MAGEGQFLIDLSNYDSLLIQSSEGRAGSPDGNVFFDTANGTIEYIRADELATIDLSSIGGAADADNPLGVDLGLKFEAAYAFENQERGDDEALRKFNRWTSGTFKYGGAYNYINSRKPATDADRAIIRSSGWNEYASDGEIDRIYYGNKGLSDILTLSQPYYMLSDSATPVLNDLVPADYAKDGQFDEAIQVYGTTANTPSDTGAGDFDTRAYEAVSIRTFGQTYDRKNTIDDLGIAELGPYYTGFAVNEGDHLTTGNYTLADVYTAQIAPWTGMTLEKLSSAVTKDEFAEAAGDFTWVLNNTGDGSVDQMVAFLDASSQDAADIDSGAQTTTFGKRVGTWYYYDAEGKVVTRSGADSLGLYLYNVPVADQQKIIMTDDAGSLKSYSFTVSVEAEVGATAKADTNAWYHSFFAALYNTAGAIPVQDNLSQEVKGNASAADGDYKIIFGFDYTGDNIGGTPNTDKECVFLCEGDGGATQQKTLYTITKITTVAFACAPGVENNA